MTKSRGPGGKGRRKAKSGAGKVNELIFAEEESCYAFVKENNGSGHFKLLCQDGKERMGVLRGSMRRRVWVRRGDIVLVTTRDFQDEKCDIVHKYTSTEVTTLSAMKEIPDELMKHYVSLDGEDVQDEEYEDAVVFVEEDQFENIDNI